MIDYTKRTRKQTAQLAAKYWANFIRKTVSGYEVVGRAKLDDPMQEMLGGYMVDKLIESAKEEITPELVDRFEIELVKVILDGYDTISQFDNEPFYMDGLNENGHHYSLGVDYGPDGHLSHALEAACNNNLEIASSISHVFSYKTNMGIRQEGGKSKILVREGYASAWLVLLDDLTTKVPEDTKNHEWLAEMGFEYKSHYDYPDLEVSCYSDGKTWIVDEEFYDFVQKYSHDEFKERFKEIYKNRELFWNKPKKSKTEATG